MEEKRNDLFTLGIPAAILLAFVIMDVFFRVGLFTRHNVAEQDSAKPEYSLEKVLNGQYFEEYEAFLQDQFYNADRWASIVQFSETILGRREFNGVYLGKKQTLFACHRAEDYEGEPVEGSLRFLEKMTKEYDAKIMLIPTADEIWRNRLSFYADTFDQKAYLEEFKKQVGKERYVDVLGKLSAKREDPIYYRTEQAWNNLGAYYGYQAWCEHSGEKLLYQYDPADQEIVLQRFAGSLMEMSGLKVPEEKISAFRDLMEKDVTVTYGGKEDLKGYYRTEYLDSDHPLGYILGDGFGVLKITTQNQQQKTLFVIGDSYANAVIPLIAEHYRTVWLVDPKQYQGDFWGLVKCYGRGDNVDVLVLESVTGLLEQYQ